MNVADSADARDAAPTDFEEGRYLFCAVRAEADADFSADGIGDESVYLIVRDGIGTVVQAVDAVYDSEDLAQVRRWLLDHQRVVDEAGEAFGTPLPFRFDTILTGDDEAVAEWLDARRGELDDALSWLAGRWEYRVEVRWDEAAIADTLEERDDALRALASRAEAASEGTAYLLESQYETRLADRMDERRRELEAGLYEDLEPYAIELKRTGDGDGRFSSDEGDGLESAVRLSILAPADHEDAIGEVLEPIAARPAHEVRYTGPWPPYSFASTIGGEEQA